MTLNNRNNTSNDNPLNFQFTGDGDVSSVNVWLMIIAVTAFMENITIFLVVLTSKKLRKQIVFVYLMSLLFAQMLISAVAVPMYCYAKFNPLFGYIIAFVVIAYIINLCGITYERFLAIHKPYMYVCKISYSKSIRYICFSWVISLVTQLLPVFWKDSDKAHIVQRVYLGIILVSFLILPMVWIWYAYIAIVYELVKIMKYREKQKIKKSKKVENSESPRPILCPNKNSKSPRKRSDLKLARLVQLRKDIHLACVFGIAAVTSTVTWIPVIFMNVTDVFDCVEYLPSNIGDVSVFFLGCNAFLDPIIYGLCLKGTRQRLKELLGRPFKRRNGAIFKQHLIQTKI